MQINNEGSMDINNIDVKQGWPLAPILLGFYTYMIKQGLEEEGCNDVNKVGLIVVIFQYVDDIILLAKIVDNLHKQLKALL